MKPNTEELQHRLHSGLLSGPITRNVLLSLLLVLATVALYFPVHGHPFINYDDPPYVTENPHIQTGLDLDTAKWAFTHSYSHNWHPLTWISHAVDIEMFGLDPAGHHDVNVFLHSLNAVLLFWILQRATGFTGRSFMVAALFALHPINVESVAWVAERKNLLSMLFFLLALGAYRWFAQEPRRDRYLVVAFLYALALMAKPQVITLPFVLLLWDYWPLQRMFAQVTVGATSTAVYPARTFSQLVSEKLPLLAIAAASAIVTIRAQHVAASERWPYTFSIRLGNAMVSYVRYIGQAFWPARLAPMYIHPGYSLKFYQAFASFVFLLAIIVLVWAGRRHRYLPVGWFWFLGTLVPMIGLVQVSVQAMADRYAYQSFVGLFIMVCWGVAEWSERRHLRSVVLAGGSVAVLVVLSAAAHRQISYWKDSLTLWSHALQVTNNNWVAELNVGNALVEKGHPDQAMPYYYKSAAINPSYAATNLNIALYDQEHGNLTEAIEYYKRVVTAWQMPEERVFALKQMARAYHDLGDDAHARECIEAAKRPVSPTP